MMTESRKLLTAAALAVATGVVTIAAPVAKADTTAELASNCPASTTFDNTTPEQARAKIAAANYWNIEDLRKNCDNTWEATAMYNGQVMRVLLATDDQTVQDLD
jgi:hypothetical protein